MRSGEWKGHTGKRDHEHRQHRHRRLGPRAGDGLRGAAPLLASATCTSASSPTSTRPISSRRLRDLDADETLFIISSKTFGTLETLTNATSARDVARRELGDDSAVAKHFVAVSTNAEKVAAFGIDTENMFVFWDWVGGRYSMESAIGLSTMLADRAGALRRDARRLPRHGRALPHGPARAEPARAAWGCSPFGIATSSDARRVGVMPYDQYLKRLPAYLQQLTMESNGKHVTLEGTRVDYETGAVYWGEPGTNGQHSFYQLIHQGTTIVPVDLIGFAKSLNPLGEHHDILSSNVFAQAQALAFGKTADEVRAEGTPERGRASPRDGGQPTDQRAAGRSPHAADPRLAHRAVRTLASSPRAPSGASTRSTSGASNSAKQLAVAIIPELEIDERADARPRLIDQRTDHAVPTTEEE